MAEPFTAPKGTYDVLPDAAAGPPLGHRHGRGGLSPLRLPAHRHAHLRGDPSVHARGGRLHRHRPQGDVHLRGPGRPQHDPASRRHGAGGAGLRGARHAHAAAAGEALLPQPHVPLREPAVGPLPAALPAGRRGVRLGGAGARRRGHRRAGGALPGARADRRRAAAQLHGLQGVPPRLLGGAARLSCRRTRRDSVRRMPRAGAASTRCGRSTARCLRCRAALERRPRLPDYLCPDCAEHHARVQGRAWTCRASPSSRTTRWCAAWTTTPAPRSSSSRRCWARSRESAGEGATTTWSRPSAGRTTPGVGFGTGVERILLAVSRSAVEAAGAAGAGGLSGGVGDEARGARSSRWRTRCAAGAWRVELDYMGRSAKGQMKQAGRSGARYAVIIGEAEMADRHGHGARPGSRAKRSRCRAREAVALVEAAAAELPAAGVADTRLEEEDSRWHTETNGAATIDESLRRPAGQGGRLGPPAPRPRRSDLRRPARPHRARPAGLRGRERPGAARPGSGAAQRVRDLRPPAPWWPARPSASTPTSRRARWRSSSTSCRSWRPPRRRRSSPKTTSTSTRRCGCKLPLHRPAPAQDVPQPAAAPPGGAGGPALPGRPGLHRRRDAHPHQEHARRAPATSSCPAGCSRASSTPCRSRPSCSSSCS